jgi:hypothetical protein
MVRTSPANFLMFPRHRNVFNRFHNSGGSVRSVKDALELLASSVLGIHGILARVTSGWWFPTASFHQRFTLHTARCTLQTTHCTCMLYIPQFTQQTRHCTMHAARASCHLHSSSLHRNCNNEGWKAAKADHRDCCSRSTTSGSVHQLLAPRPLQPSTSGRVGGHDPSRGRCHDAKVMNCRSEFLLTRAQRLRGRTWQRFFGNR